jgi:signal transduction histidine kinase/phage shock protein PspC (stress-responsive transcriptional regulator)
MDVDRPAPRSPLGLPPGLVRSGDDRVVAGVCGGVARHLGVDPIVVRLVVIVLTVANGLGLVAYLLAWAVLPDEGAVGPSTTQGSQQATERTTERAVAVGLITLGALLALRELDLLVADRVVWPVALVAVGLALVWTRSTDADRERWRERANGLPGSPVAALGTGRAVVLRITGGAVLLIVGIAVLVHSGGVLGDLGRLGVAVLATALGVVLLMGPWIVGLWRDLAAERRERIRSEERAEMAAHLHDSVLQTLALIQRHAETPGQARSLARRQERELRAWLYGDRAPATGAGTLRAALDALAGEVEADHEVVVEVVTVGDCPLDEAVEALALAVREATVNAARHAGVDEVSVYVEVEPERVTAFVRDRGCGFDPAAVAPGRLGIARSMVGRLRRQGGRVEIHSTPGEGTEVVLEVPRL